MQANNLHMTTRWQLSERYSHLTTHMMLTMLNSVLIPYGLLLTAFACILQFWSDKYGLLRLYQPLPPVNDRLARSTRQALSLCLLIHFLFTCYYFSGWPFDFLCPSHSGELSSTGKEVASTYGLDEGLWKICDQRFFENKMTDQDAPYWNHHQRVMVHIYRNMGLAIVTILMSYMFLRGSSVSLYNLFLKKYDEETDITSIPFSAVDHGELYVPQMSMSYYSINYNHHLQAAEISFDQEHICWRAKTTDEYKSNNFFL